MLRKKSNFKLGKNPTGFLVLSVVVGLLGSLSVAAFCSIPPLKAMADEMNVAAILTPSITLSMSSSVSENVEPTVGGSFKNIATVARVQVMNSEYYDISISGNPDMVGAANPDAKIAAISGDKTQANFTANTWGYAASKNAANVKTPVAATTSTVYKAVPATSTQIVSRQSTTSNAADDYYSLNFGAKVDTSIPADAYTSRVTVSVVASPVQATEYSLTYNANGGSNVPSKQTASSYEASYEFTVATGTPTRSGYTFVGWASSAERGNAGNVDYSAGGKITVTESAPAKTIYASWVANTNYSVTYNGNGNTSGTAPAAQTANSTNAAYEFTVAAQGNLAKTGYTFLGWAESSTATSATYTAGSTKVQLTSASPSKTLYAVWKLSTPFGGVTTMQALTVEYCKGTDIGETKQFTDNRASTNKDTSSINKYWVTKLPDGNCWMTQNLDYAPTVPLSTSSVSVDKNDTGKIWDDSLKVISEMSFSGSAIDVSGKTASANKDFVGPVSGDTYNAHYLTGNYYQYSIAQTACSEIGSQWNLPTSSRFANANGSFDKLLKSVDQNTILVGPYYFPPAGHADAYRGSMYGVGTSGGYWSSTPSETDGYGYQLIFSNSEFRPSYYLGPRYSGYPVRCYVNGN